MVNKGNIIVVDDTPTSLKLLINILKSEGYEVRSSISGELALHAAISNPPDLILLDIRMPDMDGLEVCRRLKANLATQEVPVIFISAVMETDEKVKGFELGAVDYVTKPYQRDELLARVRTHLELQNLRTHLEDMIYDRTSELIESERKLRATMLDSITALASAMGMRDPYTAGHQQRVAQLAVAIAKQLNLSEEQIEGVNLASIVHDVGKIQIPAEILIKPEPLHETERNLIELHPQCGFEILKNIDFPWPIALIVLQHHERVDGKGYPNGLKGDAILIEARIIAVADAVEAISSHRPYRPGLGVDAALKEIVQNQGTQFDPQVVDACLAVFKDRDYVYE